MNIEMKPDGAMDRTHATRARAAKPTHTSPAYAVEPSATTRSEASRASVGRWLRRVALSLAGGIVLASLPAQAGQSCEPYRPNQVALTKTFSLAARTAQWLDQSGAKVAIIARAGQDLRAYGLRFSHAAFVYREDPRRLQAAAPLSVDGAQADHEATAQHRPGTWRVVHMLNRCGTDHSDLYRQGLAEFFNDQPFRWQAAIVIPTAQVQAALQPLMTDARRLRALHERDYSMVAYPWSQTYQQSNAWVLETLTLALEPSVKNRRVAQAWLMMHDYRPGTLRISAARRFGATLTRANVRFDDHPSRQLQRNRVETVTADSLLGWLNAAGYGSTAVLLE